MKQHTTLILFFIIFSTSSAQNSYIKVLGRSGADRFYRVDETNDGGLLFPGALAGYFCFTRCDSMADTIFTNSPLPIPDISFNNMCPLMDGRLAVAGSLDAPDGSQGALIILDSAGNFMDSIIYPFDEGWGTWGIDVYPMPDSGALFMAYTDGKTCSNTIDLHYVDQSLNSVWNTTMGTCDASVYYSYGFSNTTNRMHFLALRYYDVDSLGNVYEDVPQVSSLNINDTFDYGPVHYIEKNFTGVSDVSDGGVIVFGNFDTLGSKQIHLMKLSPSGAISWTQTFGTPYDDVPVDVIETDDHGFAILSSQYVQGTSSGVDLVFYKTDSLGQIQFSQVYGTTSVEFGLQMIKKRDGSLVILGRTFGFGQKINMVIHLNSLGQMNSAYSINSSGTHYCNGDTATLSVSPAAAHYLWSTGDTTSTIKITSTGTYQVTVTDASGNSQSVPFTTIYFDSQPSANISSVMNDTICSGQVASLTVAAGNGNTYQWFRDSVLIDTCTYTICNAGVTGIYQCIVSNACATDTSLPVPVIVHPLPMQPVISVFPSAHECSNTPITLTTNNPASDTLHWQWYQHDVATDTLTITQSDSYVISVTATDSFGCVSDQSQDILIMLDAPPVVNFLDSMRRVCIPGAYVLSYTTSNNFGLFYYYKDGIMYDSSTYPLYVTGNDSCTISVTMTNLCGTGSDSVLVRTIPKPVINYYPATPKVCSGNPVLVTCINEGNYQWSSPWQGNLTTNQSILIQWGGDYTLLYTDTVIHCSNSSTFHVYDTQDSIPLINPLPDTVICQGTTINLFAGNFATYLWSTGDSTSTISITNSGIIDTMFVSVRVTDSLNCFAADTGRIILDICSSSENNILSKDLKVYPNPSSDEIVFELPEHSNATLYVFDLSGKLLMRKESSDNNFIRLKAADFSTAQYSYIIQIGDERLNGVIEFVK